MSYHICILYLFFYVFKLYFLTKSKIILYKVPCNSFDFQFIDCVTFVGYSLHKEKILLEKNNLHQIIKIVILLI